MTEALIRMKIIRAKEEMGFVCWYPRYTKYSKAQDIFGAFDLICISDKGRLELIQFTTVSNFASRMRKVREFLDGNGIHTDSFKDITFMVMGYREKTDQFEVKFL